MNAELRQGLYGSHLEAAVAALEEAQAHLAAAGRPDLARQAAELLAAALLVVVKL